MKLLILAAGHMKDSPEKDLLSRYEKRLTWPLEVHEIKQETPSTEAQQFLKLLKPDSYIVSLDERGKNLSTIELSDLFLHKVLPVYKYCTFIIGGADGLCDSVTSKSHLMLSLGKLTWPHMLVRCLLVEQLYRLQQIQNNHPYHRN
jgi:23S rRNA (pseudouridine1915-N3)-methyltransferase